MDKVATLQKFSLYRDADWEAVEASRQGRLWMWWWRCWEMSLHQPKPCLLQLLLANLELDLVCVNQTEVIPLITGSASVPKGNAGVPTVRAMVNLEHSSLVDEVTEKKRKNSQLAQELSTVSLGTSNKKKRLIKESKLISL